MLLNKKISVSFFIRTIKFDIIAIAIYAIVIGIADNNKILSQISIPISITAILGTCVSLLLAFRTSQAYERWWEARIVWGAIVNDSRTLIRQVKQYLPDENGKELKDFAERQIVWCIALSESLRGKQYSGRVKEFIDEHKVTGRNIPNSIINAHSQSVKALKDNGRLSEFAILQIDNTLMRLCDSMGKCERIKNTVFPRSYSLLVHFLIYSFTTILPFGLSDESSIGIAIEILICATIPIFFIAIEKTAILMQDPFENSPLDVPMTTLSETIEVNLLQTVDADYIPPHKEINTTYYSL